MNKKLLKHALRVAEPLIWFLFGFLIFKLFLGETALASVLYSLIIIGSLSVFESAVSLIVGSVKGARVLIAMNRMQKELSKVTNKEIKGE